MSKVHLDSHLRKEESIEDYVLRIIGQLQVNDRLHKRLKPNFHPKPLNFDRIRKFERLRECDEPWVENLLSSLVRSNRLHVTNGEYYLPGNIVELVHR